MKRLLTFSVAALGISAVMSQLVVMREFMAVFSGNELTFGIILGNWTLLTGIGSYLGKKIPRNLTILAGSQLGIGVLPLVQLFLLRTTKNYLFVQGEIANLTEIFAWSLILLAPFCILTGMVFVLSCNVYSTERKPSDIGRVYVIESLGSITGGALFSFVLIYISNQVQVAYFILLLNVTLSFVVSFSAKSKLSYLSLVFLLVFSLVFYFFDINGITIQKLYQEQAIVYEKNSLYGHIVVTEMSGQFTVFENSVPLFSTEDVVKAEETAHYALVQTDRRNLKVLLIGGGASVKEVLKHPVSTVDYVELDPDLIEVEETLIQLKAHVFEMDGRKYVKESDTIYDVVILDVPDPDSAQLNRFYTVEFFEEVKRIMAEDGVFSLGLTASPNYMGEPTQQLNSSIYWSLKSVFENVIIIPGGENYFLASDAGLTYEIAKKIEEKNVQTVYVNRFYLQGVLTEDRIAMVTKSIRDADVNRDFKPEAYHYYLVYWMSQFRDHFYGFLVIMIVLVLGLFLLVAPHSVPFAVFTTGFTGTSLEIVLILGFQILYGYVYSWVGVVVTAFMVGLLVGAFYVNARVGHSRRRLVVLEFLMCAFSLVLGVVLPSMVKVGFFFMTGALGILVGAEFPLASKLYYEDVHVTAAALYSVDLLGGCLGALLVSSLLIPLLGVVAVCIMVGVLKVLSGIIVWVR